MKKLLIIAVLLLVVSFFYFDGAKYLDFDYIKAQQVTLADLVAENFVLVAAAFFAIYVVVTAVSLPGAVPLTLLAGAIFGLLPGVVLVSFASSIGATLAFLGSRYLLRDFVESKFSDKLASINAGVNKEGPFYLFTLRLIPAIPFMVINLALGLTKMKVFTYYWVSQLGMLAGTFVFVNAGTQLASIDSPSEILSAEVIGSFVLLGLFPLIAKKVISVFKNRELYKAYRKPESFDYNVIAIGGGAAGLVTSYIGSAVKAKVALVEKNLMGGDCLNYGCVPSKAIIKSAKLLHDCETRAVDYGFDKAEIQFDFAKIMERVSRVVKTVEPHDSVERYTGLGVECFQAEAKIKSPYEVEIDGKVYTTKNIVVASGGSPFVPDIPGIEEIDHRTSEDLWEIRKQPKKLIVLGGGPIGCELAQAFHRLGSEVTILQRDVTILPREDEDVAGLVSDLFAKDGLNVHCSTQAKRFEKKDDDLFVAHCETSDGKSFELEGDMVLVAVGRRPRNTGFGLEELGLDYEPNGTISVNEHLQTKFPNIYACGDVVGPYQFTHAAAHQAWFCSVNALFGSLKKFKVDYRHLPWCTYIDPEVARVGKSEKDCKKAGTKYEVVKFEMEELDRAICEDETKGFVKVLTVPGSDKIIGVTIVAAHAGELLPEFVTAMKYGLGLNKVLGTIHAYPTMAEANKYVAGEWKRANAPVWAYKWLEKYHSWKRA